MKCVNSDVLMLEKKIEDNEIIYGTNTGIGEFSEIALDQEQLKEFQKYLIYSHAAGIGDPMDIEIVRGAMCGRVNVHAKGYSAGRRIVTERMIEALNRGITPVVCEKGSVGACGDLSPMSQIALAIMGEGEVFYKGEKIPASAAWKKEKIEPLVLEARDGLSIINGSNVLTALAALTIYDTEKWLKLQDIAASMTLESLIANMKPYDARIHKLRGFSGSQKVASNINRITDESEILADENKKVQDAYSMRSTPQVAGTLRDTVDYARSQILTELNGVGDNPIFLTEDKEVLTGANFQGTPVALPMENVGTGLSMVAVLSERRMNRLTNPALSAAADQEDFVSMGMTTTQKVSKILENCYGVLGIEMMAAAQALDLREGNMAKGTKAAHEVIRKYIPKLEEDRPLYRDNNKMLEVLKSGEIIDAVEKEIGELD